MFQVTTVLPEQHKPIKSMPLIDKEGVIEEDKKEEVKTELSKKK